MVFSRKCSKLTHQVIHNGLGTFLLIDNSVSENVRVQFFKSVIQALIDFNELNPVAPLQLLLEVSNW
jgi:hypothetical protein